MRAARVLHLISLGIFAAALAVPRDAHAQITVSPMNVEVDKPAKALPKIKVTNGSKEGYSFEITVVPAAHDERGVAMEMTAAYKYSAAKLLTPTKKTFSLAAGQSTEVEIKLAAPKGKTGSVHALVWILGIPDSAKTAKTFASYLRMGVSVSVTLGEATKSFKTGKIDAAQDSAGTITFLVPVQNTSTQHFRAGGSLVVQDAAGKEIKKLVLEPAPVYPEMIRHVKAVWKSKDGAKTLAKGEYKLVAATEVEGVATQKSFGAFSMLAKGGLAQEKGSIVKMPLPATTKNKAIALEATINNQGNVAFKGTGRVTFYKSGTLDVVAQATLKPSAAIAAGAKGTLTGTLDKGLPTGSYTTRLDLLNANEFVIAQWSGRQEVADKEIKVAGSIKKFTAPSAKEPVVTVEFQNDSNIQVESEGAVLIVDSGGNIVGTVALPKQVVAPGKSFLYQDKLPQLDPGLYELRAAVNFAGQKAAATTKHYVE